MSGRQSRIPFLALLVALTLAAVGLEYYPRPGAAWIHQLTIWAVVLLAVVGFVVGYNRVSAAADGFAIRRRIVLGAVPLWIAALCVAPFDSLDLAGYLNCGRIEVVYGLNPYVTPVDRIPNWKQDSLLAGYWHDTLCAYGFLFSRIASVVVSLGSEDREATFLLFKLVNVVALALIVWLVDRGCRIANRPRSVGIFLVAWNPLLLLHGISNGHNDLLAGLGLTAALVAAQARWWWAVLPALVATALIKYSTVPLLPLAGLYLLRQHGWLRTSIGAALATGLSLAISWPYVADGSALDLSKNLANVTTFVNSIGSMVVIPLAALGKSWPAAAGIETDAASVLKAAGGMLVLGLVATLAWRRTRDRAYSCDAFIRDAVLVQFAMIAIASSKFYAWYLLMFCPTIALLPEASRLRRATFVLMVAQLGSFTFLSRAHIVSPLFLIVWPLCWYWRSARRTGHVLPFPTPIDASRRRAA